MRSRKRLKDNPKTKLKNSTLSSKMHHHSTAQKITPLGTIRVKVKDERSYIKTKEGWKRATKTFPELLAVVKLFKANKRLNILIDKINPTFFKGQLSPEGREQGARINVLPNGKILEKAFSLFSPNLRIQDESTHDHWDVIYQNKGGTFSYVYTAEKRKAHRNRKYQKVDEFEKCYTKLRTNVTKALSNFEDYMALPMYTLLNTYMRVGNEMYFKVNKHKGLTTIMKKDVKIKGSEVSFNYIGKDGVPIHIRRHFNKNYIKRLKDILNKGKKSDFVFIHPETKKVLQDSDFKKAFLRYCGKEFYPHIVRSYYATSEAKKFLQEKVENREKEVTKEEVNTLFLNIAQKLGHKRFNKKNNQWQEHYTVTVNSYIQPRLVEEIKKLY